MGRDSWCILGAASLMRSGDTANEFAAMSLRTEVAQIPALCHKSLFAKQLPGFNPVHLQRSCNLQNVCSQ